jgi:mevalonate kinase
VQAKAILAGEHFVLHGVPAIATPVSGYNLTMRLALRTGGELVLPDPYSSLSLEISAILDHRLVGFVRLFITSTIPQGAGLGSSAAFAVALGRALCEHAGFPDDESEARTMKIANLIEHQIHHRASGIDTATVSSGVPICFSLSDRGLRQIERVEVSAPIAFLLVDSGHRRATHAQINKVRQSYAQNKEQFFDASIHARSAVQELLDGLKDHDTDQIHHAIQTSGVLLKDLGLEHDACAEIRKHAESHDVALKITGAGGGGFMLAFAADETRLTAMKETLSPKFPSHRFTVGPTLLNPRALENSKEMRA